MRALVAPFDAAGGRPSIDPVVFFKLQLILFFEGIRSERQLMRLVADRLSARWYAGYDLGEALPDHSSLTKIRQRYGLETFRRFFDAIVAQGQEAGLIQGEELYIDATKVVATASLDALKPRFAVAARAHVDDLFALDREGDAPPEDAPPDPTDAPPADALLAAETTGQPRPPLRIGPTDATGTELAQANAARHDWIAAGGRRDRTPLAPRSRRARTASPLPWSTAPTPLPPTGLCARGCTWATRPTTSSMAVPPAAS